MDDKDVDILEAVEDATKSSDSSMDDKDVGVLICICS